MRGCARACLCVCGCVSVHSCVRACVLAFVCLSAERGLKGVIILSVKTGGSRMGAFFMALIIHAGH